MRLIDKQHTQMPFYGSRRMTAHLNRMGYTINRKRVVRLMRDMGLEALYPKRRLSVGNKEHRIYPYLLEGVSIVEPNHVWSSDITYIRMTKGFLYLMVILDWYSRYVLSWRLSNTLETRFCLEALDEAFLDGKRPKIFNSDQGCQFTSKSFTDVLTAHRVLISMDAKGRCFDNIFVERLWRTVKWEEVYLHDYLDGKEAYSNLSAYFKFYNENRLHQSLDYKTPSEVYWN